MWEVHSRNCSTDPHPLPQPSIQYNDVVTLFSPLRRRQTTTNIFSELLTSLPSFFIPESYKYYSSKYIIRQGIYLLMKPRACMYWSWRTVQRVATVVCVDIQSLRPFSLLRGALLALCAMLQFEAWQMSYQMTAYSKPKLPSHTNCKPSDLRSHSYTTVYYYKYYCYEL